MADTNKKKLKVGRFDGLNPLKLAKGAYRLVKGELKSKKNKRPTNPNPKQKEIDQIKKNMKNARGANKDLLQKKIDQLNKYGKMSSFKIDTTRPDYVKAKKLNESISISGSGTKKKKMSAIEKRNRERFGDAHVDKLKARHKAFKESRRKKKK